MRGTSAAYIVARGVPRLVHEFIAQAKATMRRLVLLSGHGAGPWGRLRVGLGMRSAEHALVDQGLNQAAAHNVTGACSCWKPPYERSFIPVNVQQISASKDGSTAEVCVPEGEHSDVEDATLLVLDAVANRRVAVFAAGTWLSAQVED